MQHIIHFAANYPHRVLLLVLIITGLAAFQLPRLEVRIAAEALMAEDDPLRAAHDRVLQTFGSSNAVVVVIRDPVTIST